MLDYESRLLYRQEYSVDTETDTNYVVSAMHAVSYRYPGSISPTTTRIRTTLVYVIDGNSMCSPAQGLIEQWKTEGWVPIDEFLYGELVFDSYQDYEEYVLKMVEAFLLGVPIQSTGEYTPDTTPKKTTRLVTKVKIPKKPSRKESILRNEKSETTTDLPEEIEAKKSSEEKMEKAGFEAKLSKKAFEKELNSEDDSGDDEDWI